MQKIISYSYPNRIQLLANLDGFIVEYTNVYQRNVKIYKGVDNILEFDIKNADQKRLDLNTFDSIELNLIDISGAPVGNTPYAVFPTQLKGIATVTIPATDISSLENQTFKYSVIAYVNGSPTILYTDSHFTGLGIIELVGSAIPLSKPNRIFNTFSGEIDYMGNTINHSSAIPAKFYEAVTTQSINFAINCENFIGTIYLEATTDQTISVESFKNSPQLQVWSSNINTTSTINFNNIAINDYCYFRISWHYPLHQYQFGVNNQTIGTVKKIIVS